MSHSPGQSNAAFKSLSKVEQYKLRTAESLTDNAGVGGFFGRWGTNERSGLGRVGIVVAPETVTSQFAPPPQPALGSVARGVPTLSAPVAALPAFAPIVGLPSRNSPLAASGSGLARHVATLEARELQQQLDVIRELRDADASMSYNNAALPPDWARGLGERSDASPAALPAVGRGGQVTCYCCQKQFDSAVAAFVPRDSVVVAASSQQQQQPKKKATTPTAASAAKKQHLPPQQPPRRVQSSGVVAAPAARERPLEEARGRWKM